MARGTAAAGARSPLSIPNLLSLLRMGLVPLFIIAVTRGETSRALAIFLVAGLTDGLDGFIARFWDQRTLLGAYLDPIADKLLLTAAYVTLAIPTLNPAMTIPLWVAILVIGRDIMIVVTAGLLYVALGMRSFPPNWLSKLNTFVQVAAIFLLLGHLARPLWPTLEALARAFLLAVPVFTVASALAYASRAARMAGRDRAEA